MTDQPIGLIQADLAVDYAFVVKCKEQEDRVAVLGWRDILLAAIWSGR